MSIVIIIDTVHCTRFYYHVRKSSGMSISEWLVLIHMYRFINREVFKCTAVRF